MDDAALDALRTAAGAVVDIGVVAVIGALATGGLLRGEGSGWAASRARVTRRAMGVAAGTALAGALAWLVVEAISMTELAPWAAIAQAWPIVTGTRAGALWALQVGMLAACIGLGAIGGRGPRGTAVAALAVVVLAGARASAGHAGAAGVDAQTVVMTVHLLATGAWAGAVIVGALVVLRPDGHGHEHPSASDRQAVARYLSRLSSLATAALALVVLTGAASGWHALGGRVGALLPAAAAPAWAGVLDVKLVLVAVAIALGAFNRFRTLPPLLAALATPRGDAAVPRRRFVRVLRVEAVVMLAVLVAAAILANIEPPAP